MSINSTPGHSMATQKSSKETSPWESFTLSLPEPYFTRYSAKSITPPEGQYQPTYQIILADSASSTNLTTPLSSIPTILHNASLSFETLAPGNIINSADNSAWARSRRSPSTTVAWTSIEAPTIAQLWLLTYGLFTVHYSEETIRVTLSGTETSLIRSELIAVGLAIAHPVPISYTSATPKSAAEIKLWANLPNREILLLRSAFWQGAGSPFGPRSIWLPPQPTPAPRSALTNFPPLPTTQTLTTLFPSTPVHALHPLRPAKPAPGSTIYSRYIPHLDEHFSMVILDPSNSSHVNLFHTWQNDPRVAAGWNETGTLDQHRAYIQKQTDDAHQLPVLAFFNSTPFAYFEIYWALEDHLGAHMPPSMRATGAWDRGRHSLVGDATFRGPHRTHAWWASLMHFMFLDEIRTDAVVGEPKWTNKRVLELDSEHGFGVVGWVDLGHKRSALVRCGRERFFELCTVGRPWVGKGREEKL